MHAPAPAPTPQRCRQCGHRGVPTLRWWRLPFRPGGRPAWACSTACRDAALAADAAPRRVRPPRRSPAGPCQVYGRTAPLNAGRCPSCYSYAWRHRFAAETPPHVLAHRAGRRAQRLAATPPCVVCGVPLQPGQPRRGRCRRCYDWAHRHGFTADRPVSPGKSTLTLRGGT